ncbi:response regulator [Oceanicola sp. S124]|uniref:response regulator n=1 Tax=Oceanicola sp. S124 TaxID=1042378 RepID=UPI00025593D7|nr:response regulator [Oceanicola sp. S124]
MARILIADDDPDYLSAFSEGLKVLGHDIHGVGSGEEALTALAGQDFDVVFLDVFMQGGGAISLLHAVNEAAPGMPVVVITGKAGMLDSPILTEGLRFASAKISKMTQLSELDRLVRRLTPETGG